MNRRELVKKGIWGAIGATLLGTKALANSCEHDFCEGIDTMQLQPRGCEYVVSWVVCKKCGYTELKSEKGNLDTSPTLTIPC